MVDLPQPIPSRIAVLPRDDRGFPVPWFVKWIDGKPDFRVVDYRKLQQCLRTPRCWICGERMTTHRVFVIGPMCAVNRVISEPPSHRQCAEWAVKACPFMAHPRMRRNEKDLPANHRDAAGLHLDRNPGVMCLWETKTYRPFRPHVGAPGILFRLGEPDRVDWWCEAKPASRAQVMNAIETGLPALVAMAAKDGRDALNELAACRDRVLQYLPSEARA